MTGKRCRFAIEGFPGMPRYHETKALPAFGRL